MPKKKKSKSKKAASKKPAKKKKALKKKALKKKTAKKKTARKKAVKKKTTQKKTARKPATRTKRKLSSKPSMVVPGPPAGHVPPVEEPATNEEALGTVTHYYSHLGVALVQINKGTLKTGVTIHIKGHSTDITQQVESLEYEHQHIDQANAGQLVGLKVTDHVREHDIVYLVK
jgi:hypothetical protein